MPDPPKLEPKSSITTFQAPKLVKLEPWGTFCGVVSSEIVGCFGFNPGAGLITTVRGWVANKKNSPSFH